MIKGILFDKDGTLVDFYSLWLQAAMVVIPQFLKKNVIDHSKETVQCLLRAIGVYEGTVDPKGALAYKSYAEMADDVYQALVERKEVQGCTISNQKIKEELETLFHHYVEQHITEYKVFTNMEVLMQHIKYKNITIGLATADTKSSAENCLNRIGVMNYFDYIGADDGKKKPKPDKGMFKEFEEAFCLLPEEIAVVGDTYNDMIFAKQNGGTSIGVLSGVSEQADFGSQADYVIDSIHELPELLEQM